MTAIVDYRTVDELGRRYRASADACSARHFQAIWWLAQGRPLPEVAATTGMSPRWLERRVRRYNQGGPDSLGDRRRGNGAKARILTPDLREKLKARLLDPPPDGGVWTTPKIALWRAGELGLVSVFPQRAWDALRMIGWTIQVPRPRHPASAPPEEREACKKAGRGCRRGGRPAPGQTGRGLGHGRAPQGLEADPVPGLGAPGPAPDRVRPPSL